MLWLKARSPEKLLAFLPLIYRRPALAEFSNATPGPNYASPHRHNMGHSRAFQSIPELAISTLRSVAAAFGAVLPPTSSSRQWEEGDHQMSSLRYMYIYMCVYVYVYSI